MILLWGLPKEGPLAAVYAALHTLGAQVTLLDQRDVLDTSIELIVDASITGSIRTTNQIIDLGAVTAAYFRPYDSQRLPQIEQAGSNSAAWLHAMEVEDALWSWVELTRALVVNRPAAMAANNSKPYQAAQIQAFGFKIPETLITTDPTTANEFWVRHGTVIYKSISGIRSIVSRFTAEDMKRLDSIVWCPTQFQQYIPGTDYRVHVVQEEVFACEIFSEADDYRYAARQGTIAHISSYELPTEWADRCRAMAAAMGLLVAGVDLRRTPDGDWYCFEVNPSPGYTYYQQATNQAIDQAIARLLMSGGSVANIYKDQAALSFTTD